MKQYYSIRNGKNPNIKLTLDMLRRGLYSVYRDLESRSYFDEYFGKNCTDNFVPGLLGIEIELKIQIMTRNSNLWPIWEKYEYYSEDDVFDMIEFLYDHISKPLEEGSFYHSWNDCGRHYENFDKIEGRIEFWNEINQYLNDYGYKLDTSGFIIHNEEEGLSKIFDAKIPTEDISISEKIHLAQRKYLESRNSMNERKMAIRELADIFEELRGEMKGLMDKKDEDAIFNIANKFHIRHSNPEQMKEYDKDIWYSWMFYFYLSTIHTLLRLIERQKK